MAEYKINIQDRSCFFKQPPGSIRRKGRCYWWYTGHLKSRQLSEGCTPSGLSPYQTCGQGGSPVCVRSSLRSWSYYLLELYCLVNSYEDGHVFHIYVYNWLLASWLLVHSYFWMFLKNSEESPSEGPVRSHWLFWGQWVLCARVGTEALRARVGSLQSYTWGCPSTLDCCVKVYAHWSVWVRRPHTGGRRPQSQKHSLQNIYSFYL